MNTLIRESSDLVQNLSDIEQEPFGQCAFAISSETYCKFVFPPDFKLVICVSAGAEVRARTEVPGALGLVREGGDREDGQPRRHQPHCHHPRLPLRCACPSPSTHNGSSVDFVTQSVVLDFLVMQANLPRSQIDVIRTPAWERRHLRPAGQQCANCNCCGTKLSGCVEPGRSDSADRSSQASVVTGGQNPYLAVSLLDSIPEAAARRPAGHNWR